MSKRDQILHDVTMGLFRTVSKMNVYKKSIRPIFKFGDMSCFNQHPWMHLNLNTILVYGT